MLMPCLSISSSWKSPEKVESKSS